MLSQHPQADWIIHFKHTRNTMHEADILLDSGKVLPDKILIISDDQYGGIGRNNNFWTSPPGGLWFTYMIKSTDINSQIALLLGLTLHHSILHHFPVLANELRLKWPNDLLFKGKKLAGILAKSRQGYLCFGIGLNTNVLEFDGIPSTATSLKAELGFQICHFALLYTFLTEFNSIYADYQKTGLLKHIPAINANLYGVNRKVTFDKGLDTISGICLGVNGEGALLLENENGQITQNYSGSIIRFDG